MLFALLFYFLFHSIFLFYLFVHKSNTSATLRFLGVLCRFEFGFFFKLVFFIDKLINVLDTCFDFIQQFIYSY